MERGATVRQIAVTKVGENYRSSKRINCFEDCPFYRWSVRQLSNVDITCKTAKKIEIFEAYVSRITKIKTTFFTK